MFGRKGLSPQGQASSLKILVRASSARTEAPDYALACDVVDFVNHALRNCQYERGELPQEALWAYHVDYYVAQVNNGGHGQFAHNSGWEDFVLADIRQGLRAIAAGEALEMFETFLTFAAAEPGRFAGVEERAGFGEEDGFVERLDQRFFAGIGDQIRRALRDWLLRLPMVEFLDAAQYTAAMRTLVDQHPERDSRRAAREEGVQREREADPIYQACNHVCRLTPGEIRFQGWQAGRPMEGGGSVITVATSAGAASVYLLPERAALVMSGEQEPRSKISMAVIAGFLARQGLALPAQVAGEG
jgi:hypothetical protein